MVWGSLMAVNIGKCCPKAIRCPKVITDFTVELVKNIDMKAYGGPQIVMFGDGNKKGYTMTQLIETSNITAHFCEQDNGFFLDIFSCKAFDPKTVVKTIDVYFKPTFLDYHIIHRDFPTKKLC